MATLDDDALNRTRAYTTDYYAEFYDIWNGTFWGRHFIDEETHWETIASLLASHKDQSTPFNVVDIGAGSGRELKDILERARDTATPLPNLHFYAIDSSKPMLNRGEAYVRARPELQKIAPVKWVQASAEDFTSAVPEVKGQGDVLLWPGGGFSHLTSKEAQLSFLRQMAATLRSPESVGLILVLDQSIPSRADPVASEVFEEPHGNLDSVDSPGVTYEKSRNEVVWKGDVRHDRWTVTVRKDGKDVHVEEVEHTLMNLDEEGWPGLVGEVGLKIGGVKEVKGVGVFYYLQKRS